MTEQYPTLPPQPGPPPPEQSPYAGNQMKNGLGTGSLILGILTIVFSWVPFAGFGSYVTGIIGLLTGLFGIRRVNHHAATNRGVATAGVITSVVGLLSVILATVVYVSAIYGAMQDSADTSAAGGQPVAAATSQQPSTQPSQEPTQDEASPEPDGKYGGSCDYDLGTTLGDYNVFGEVDVRNTGNVGIKVKAKITWPQLGYKPIKMTKTVKVPYGHKKVVRFHTDATSTQIERLQSWQLHHDFKDGCTYKATILDTFGRAH